MFDFSKIQTRFNFVSKTTHIFKIEAFYRQLIKYLYLIKKKNTHHCKIKTLLSKSKIYFVKIIFGNDFTKNSNLVIFYISILYVIII